MRLLEELMRVIKPDYIICPIEGATFAQVDKQWVCGHDHHFDVARQGYVNLLPAQQKKSKDPGDSKAMIFARTQFLDAGYYQPIAENMNALAMNYLPETESLNFMDAGCGEGYYFNHWFNHLNDYLSDQQVSFTGLDISKWAIQAAAKRNKQMTWIVGSNKSPPVKSASIDLLFSLFGYYQFPALIGCLNKNGHLILVEAGTDHLIELRKMIYPTIKQTKTTDPNAKAALGLYLIEQQTLSYQTDAIHHDQIMHLMTMTPHLYRATHAGKEKVAQLTTMKLTVDVVFSVFGVKNTSLY